jgi:hypothetical protein
MADNGTFQSTQDLLFPDWQPQYRAALLETNPQQLHKSVFAEEAMFRRMQAPVSAPNGDAERRAIHDAIRVLRVIQVEKLNYPSWPGDKIQTRPILRHQTPSTTT